MTNFVRAMRMRTRYALVLALVGLVPLVLSFIIGTRATEQMNQRGSAMSAQVLELSREQGVTHAANTLASQIDQYLKLHPEIDDKDPLALQNNADLVAIASEKYGETGYSFVFNTQGVVLFHPQADQVGVDLSTIAETLTRYWHIISVSMTGSTGQGYYDWPINKDQTESRWMITTPVGDTTWRVGMTITSAELLKPFTKPAADYKETTRGVNLLYLLISLVAGVLVVVAAIFLSRELSAEIVVMANNMAMVLHSLPESIDLPPNLNELESLHQGFVEMSRLVRDLRTNLDKNVRVRTADLARRSMQVETASQVAREAANILDVRKLLDQTPKLIGDRFGFYHAGIFLVDASGEFAVLQASNSEGGKRLVAKGHRIKVGEGVVGHVVQTSEIRVVEDVNLDDVHMRNPELPRTRSELTMPLKVHGKVIGALDVQSTEPNAFSEEDIKILSILGDQVALAIMNARLLQESQQALRELNALYGQQAREAWRQRVGRQPLAFAFTPMDVEQATPITLQASEQVVFDKSYIQTDETTHKMAVPIMLRGQPLGSLILQRDLDKQAWTNEELELMQELAGQFANALENARLMETIQRQTQQVRMVGDIAAKAQRSLDLDTVIRTSVEEIGAALQATRVQIRLGMAAGDAEALAQPIPTFIGNGQVTGNGHHNGNGNGHQNGNGDGHHNGGDDDTSKPVDFEAKE